MYKKHGAHGLAQSRFPLSPSLPCQGHFLAYFLVLAAVIKGKKIELQLIELLLFCGILEGLNFKAQTKGYFRYSKNIELNLLILCLKIII